MHRDIIAVAVAVIVVFAAAFAGSAAAVHEIKKEIAVEMATLRADYQPAVCKLFATQAGTGQP